jgi:hypothetical protein
MSISRPVNRGLRRNNDELASPAYKLPAEYVEKPAGPRRALRIIPSGDLLWEFTQSADEVESAPPLPAATEARLAEEFGRGAGFGLLYLGAMLVDTPLPAGLTRPKKKTRRTAQVEVAQQEQVAIMKKLLKRLKQS